MKTINKIPTYKEAVELCSFPESPFYESKMIVDGYNISVFNYRLAQGKDFSNPIPDKPELKGYEMRGLSFVFNTDGSLYKRFILLEKFFNLNQVQETLYSVVKNYKIKFINNKEDGSIASFIKLPNGKIIGKSKMGFDNDQANGINRVYKTNSDIKLFVDWCLSNDISPIFEYVSPNNRIVLKYSDEELILLRLRDNKTGKHIDIRQHLDKIGSIRIAQFEDDIKDLDNLIELTAVQVDKEGSIVTCEDEFGRDFFFKIKTPWYNNLHSVYTNDLYHEDRLIKLIIDKKIDDIICELKEDDHLRRRVDEIIFIIRKCIREKICRINDLYNVYKKLNSIKEFAINYYKNEDFSDTMKYIRDNNISLDDLAKNWILKKTNKLEKARVFIENIKTNQ
jgi:T4 RnlA family RNA ligase